MNFYYYGNFKLGDVSEEEAKDLCLISETTRKAKEGKRQTRVIANEWYARDCIHRFLLSGERYSEVFFNPINDVDVGAPYGVNLQDWFLDPFNKHLKKRQVDWARNVFAKVIKDTGLVEIVRVKVRGERLFLVLESNMFYKPHYPKHYKEED